MMESNKNIDFVFFGTPDIAVTVLEELSKAELVPKLVVTAPDRPAGRGMQLASPPVKVWAEEHNIPLLQPEKLSDPDVLEKLQDIDCELGVLVAYGKIIPKQVLDTFTKDILNMHPSLLPKYRGPSPIQSQILADDQEVGVTIMLLDEEVDHGDIVASQKLKVESKKWPMCASELEDTLAHLGGQLMTEVLPQWAAGEIQAQPQDHAKATYTHMIKKADAELDLNEDSYQNYLKFCAYDQWPRAFFITKNGIRVVVTDAEYTDDEFVIKKVIPAGKSEMDYEQFIQHS